MEVPPHLLYGTTIILSVLLVMLAMLTTFLNVRRKLRERRRSKQIAALRPRILAALDGEPIPHNALTKRERATFIEMVRTLLPTLRGAESSGLTTVLEEWGIIEAALLGLHHRSALRRARAADLLGLARVQRAVPELLRLLDDRSFEVRQIAARALGLIGDPAAVRPLLQVGAARRVPLNTTTMALLRMDAEALEPLLDGLRVGTAPVRGVCAELLGLRGSVAAVSALTTALDRREALDVRIRAARALGRIGAPTAVDALSAAMGQDEPPALRAVATRALGQIGGRRTVALLYAELGAQNHIVAVNAARALAKAGDDGIEALSRASRDVTARRGEYAREGLSYVMLDHSRIDAA
jgi:hypothetical protein